MNSAVAVIAGSQHDPAIMRKLKARSRTRKFVCYPQKTFSTVSVKPESRRAPCPRRTSCDNRTAIFREASDTLTWINPESGGALLLYI
jgi:hypothetical protein